VGRAVKPGEWPAYARDPGGMRHSPLTQVNRDNVGQLELAWTYLPAGAQATPMTYEVRGTQYVVISEGGHGKLGATLGDYVMAFSLPRGRK
jgi:glucose dehydrogenase